ncbi:MAG: hypothetical protein IPF92_21445 [Myxococcales bacterium]|nr:hypothetical protein [Myxococcales bacterium]
MSSTANLKEFAASLRELPRVVGHRVAAACAPVLTALVVDTSDASADAYGAAWAPGADGQTVTLRKSGALLNGVRYVAIGSKLRLALTTKYAKYQVGRRPVTPRQGEALPPAYARALDTTARLVIREALR